MWKFDQVRYRWGGRVPHPGKQGDHSRSLWRGRAKVEDVDRLGPGIPRGGVDQVEYYCTEVR